MGILSRETIAKWRNGGFFNRNGSFCGIKQLTYYPKLGYGSLDFCDTFDQAKVARLSPPMRRGKDVRWGYAAKQIPTPNKNRDRNYE